MSRTVHFRAYRDDDLLVLEQMSCALYQEDASSEGMSPAKIRRTAEELSRHPDKGRINLFVADEIVLGYAIVIYYWSNEYGGNLAAIDELYVKPAWRCQGIATSFLDHLAATEGAGLQGLLLEVTPRNERAFTLYSRQGFVPAKNRFLFKRL